MEFGIFDFLTIIGALGFFIYGMKVMSDGIQKVAGNQLREILKAMTSNKFKGVFTGFLITSIVQSSSATTVMVVSFVNAGLLSLTESISVVMGANIGTTITAWLITLFGFKVKIAHIALPIIGLSFPLMFSGKERYKNLAEVFIGFALLFLGLDELKHSMPNFTGEQLAFLESYTGLGVLSTIMFVFVGTLLTILVQSSSAAMALTLVLCNQGVIPFEMAAAMVLGENIGTTITANLASLIANATAKRTARAHFIFNGIGVTWMIILFSFFIQGIDSLMIHLGYNSPFEDPEAVPTALSIFHTIFNVLNTFMLIWFIPQIRKIVLKMVKDDNESKDFKLKYISKGIFDTPEVAIIEAQRETIRFSNLLQEMLENIDQAIMESDAKTRKKLIDNIIQQEEFTNVLEEEIAVYLSKVAKGNISDSSSRDIRVILSIINEMERIADLFLDIAKTLTKKYEEKVWFNNQQKDAIAELLEVLKSSIQVMIDNIANGNKNKIDLNTAQEIENKINTLRNSLRKKALNDLQSGQSEMKSALAFSDIISTVERTGDHIINVSESLVEEA